MGNIVNDIVDDVVENVEIKPNKTKVILKRIVIISLALISIAYTFGQFKSSFFNRIDSLEMKINSQTTSIKNLEKTTEERFIEISDEIDEGYNEGIEILTEFQNNINQQLMLIIDYGSSNKVMLKRMIDVNSMNINAEVKKKKFNTSNTKDYYGMLHFIAEGDNDTTFYVTGATQEFINDIDVNNYDLGEKKPSENYNGRYDISYRNRKR